MNPEDKNLFDDAIEKLMVDDLEGSEFTCGLIHPYVTGIMQETANNEIPLNLISDLQKRIAACISSEMVMILLNAADQELGLREFKDIFESAVRLGFAAEQRYHEQQGQQ